MLPEGVTIPDAAAAAQQSLRARGMVIRRADITATAARIVAADSRDGWLEQTAVTAHVKARRTHVVVTVEPLGREHDSREILQDMLERLGI